MKPEPPSPSIESTQSFIIHRSFIVRACLGVFIAVLVPRWSSACPFCLAVEPTLAQRRDAATAVAVGEASDLAANDERSRSFLLHTLFKGPVDLKRRKSVKAGSPSGKPGTPAILFATPIDRPDKSHDLDWSAVFANEALLGYFASAPELREPPEKRLAYFVRYLEHADRDIARDAYLEFAHASYEDVLAVADKFDYAALRQWLQSPTVPDDRKGFYGLALGMTKSAKDRSENRSLLKRLIEEDRSDFRAGLDGIMAGFLLLDGKDALKRIEWRYFASEKAKHGDVRHATSALRFYYEYGPKELRPHVAAATAKLVERPPFAAAAITDLARWDHWQVLGQVAALYERPDFDDGPTRRAIVGFLKACPEPRAAEALDRLKKRDPQGIDAAEKSLLLTTGS
jgi:hypothetical protein